MPELRSLLMLNEMQAEPRCGCSIRTKFIRLIEIHDGDLLWVVLCGRCGASWMQGRR